MKTPADFGAPNSGPVGICARGPDIVPVRELECWEGDAVV